jgi:hypothetical protein
MNVCMYVCRLLELYRFRNCTVYLVFTKCIGFEEGVEFGDGVESNSVPVRTVRLAFHLMSRDPLGVIHNHNL